MASRDDQEIPFTVKDRLLMEEIHNAVLRVEGRINGQGHIVTSEGPKARIWDQTTADVNYWLRTGRNVWVAVGVVLSWLTVTLTWHK